MTIAAPLLRLRSDQQLVAQFRGGNEDAFRVIHDRYRARLLAYVRQMLPGPNPDAEDTLQDVFVRAYAGLRAGNGELSLRPWLYRIAHNRCVDVVRRPQPAATEPLELERAGSADPAAESERRESLRRLVTDIGRLPDQQRSALLMRELGGVAYADIAAALGVSVPAVKSLLVRARMGLAAALEARDTACTEIREDLAAAHERGVRASGLARRHLRDCPGCQEYRTELRSISRQFAALAPTLGPLGVLTKLLGAGGGSGAAAGGGAAAAGGAAGAGGTVLGLATSHVAALVAAAVVTAGGAVELQQTVSQLASQPRHHAKLAPARATDYARTASAQPPAPVTVSHPTRVSAAPTASSTPAPLAATPVHSAANPQPPSSTGPVTQANSSSGGSRQAAGTSTRTTPPNGGTSSAAAGSSSTPSSCTQTPLNTQTTASAQNSQNTESSGNTQTTANTGTTGNTQTTTNGGVGSSFACGSAVSVLKTVVPAESGGSVPPAQGESAGDTESGAQGSSESGSSTNPPQS